MIQRLCTTYMEPDELRKMIGDEAYFAAKKLEEQDREFDRLAKLKNQYYMAFGHELKEERAEAQWKLTMAYENWGIETRALKAENEKLKQAYEKDRENLLKLEKEKQKQLLKLEKEKQKQLLKEKEKQLLKVEKEKQKQLLKAEKEKQEQLLKAEKEKQEQLLKAEKEKQEQLLKAEKEKQEQLLKAEKEKQEQLRLKMVQTMLKLGNSVEMIADLLEVSVAQIQQWGESADKLKQ